MGIEKQIDLDLAAFSIEAIKRAAYRYSDRFAFDMAVVAGKAACTLTFEDSKGPEFIEATISAFRKELLDQDLRIAIRAETEGVRNLILAHAFSRTDLVSNGPIQDD
jgi:His-Xaa-Ser system protein HxsD